MTPAIVCLLGSITGLALGLGCIWLITREDKPEGECPGGGEENEDDTSN